jgi:hypothetical protein
MYICLRESGGASKSIGARTPLLYMHCLIFASFHCSKLRFLRIFMRKKRRNEPKQNPHTNIGNAEILR